MKYEKMLYGDILPFGNKRISSLPSINEVWFETSAICGYYGIVNTNLKHALAGIATMEQGPMYNLRGRRASFGNISGFHIVAGKRLFKRLTLAGKGSSSNGSQ